MLYEVKVTIGSLKLIYTEGTSRNFKMRDFVYSIDKCQNFQRTTNITSGHTLAY